MTAGIAVLPRRAGEKRSPMAAAVADLSNAGPADWVTVALATWPSVLIRSSNVTVALPWAVAGYMGTGRERSSGGVKFVGGASSWWAGTSGVGVAVARGGGGAWASAPIGIWLASKSQPRVRCRVMIRVRARPVRGRSKKNLRLRARML